MRAAFMLWELAPHANSLQAEKVWRKYDPSLRVRDLPLGSDFARCGKYWPSGAVTAV